MYHFCTYFDQNYLTRGLALYRSLQRHALPFTLYVLCFDEFTYEYLSQLNKPNLKPIALEHFEQGDAALLQAKQNRSKVEYYFTCTPSLLLYIINQFDDVDILTYLDADLFFYASPASIYEELGDASILIVKHRFPERLRHLERYGIYNVGLLAFRNDVHGRSSLHWWRQRCLEWCYDRLEDGKFADQKYLDDWPARFPGVVVLQHKGAGLAPWNVANYDLREKNTGITVDDVPLIFYHFHNLKMITPYLIEHGLQKYSTRLPGLLRRKLYGPYLQALRGLTREIGADMMGTTRRHQRVVRLLIKGRHLLCIGPLAVELHLEPAFRPLLRLRRKLLSLKKGFAL